ncbi:unnamed protein product [Rangifer tarandus platyrhynchus]|uniref:Uncharacterized protein n=1 Tax=Rangifer tarandus platyrhynchus TaxID=3082113 RepID=A0AC59YVC6_RANTA
MSSNHLILCRPLLLMPSIFPSLKVFSNESPGQMNRQRLLQPRAISMPSRKVHNWGYTCSLAAAVSGEGGGTVPSTRGLSTEA